MYARRCLPAGTCVSTSRDADNDAAVVLDQPQRAAEVSGTPPLQPLDDRHARRPRFDFANDRSARKAVSSKNLQDIFYRLRRACDQQPSARLRIR
jgi:hypothetical protein